MIDDPGMIFEKGLKSFALGSKEVQVRKSRVIICKGDEVTSTSSRLGRCWTPHIRVDLLPKGSSPFTSVYLGYRLSRSLSEDTGLALSSALLECR